jgi:riboflavin synthase
MFTGIIEKVGRIKKINKLSKGAEITIEAGNLLDDVKIGDSIAVNGVCLTVTSMSGTLFTADVMAETLRRSSLGELSSGDGVNLERAMSLQGRFGGHIVSGHIDGTGVIESFEKEDNAVWVSIKADSSILRLIVEKGSIAIDGISLTVAYVDKERFKVSVIPHTGEETTLLKKKRGAVVNLENDIIGKYVERLLFTGGSVNGRQPDRTENLEKNKSFAELLSGNGFI